MTPLALTRCPVCRARLRGDEPDTEPCRRCGGDLGLLRACTRQAAFWQRRARRALSGAETGREFAAARAALAAARAAVALVDLPETRATLTAALAATALSAPDAETAARALRAALKMGDPRHPGRRGPAVAP